MIISNSKVGELINTYQEQGCVYPIKVLDGEELKKIQTQYNKHESLLEEAPHPDRFKQIHLHFPWAYQLVTHPSILRHITPLLGENVLVHGSSVFCKNPGDKTYISWHQDGYYLKVKSLEYISAWIALSDSTIESGCMRFVLKSHHTILPHTGEPNPLNLLSSGLTVKEPIAQEQAVDVELKAGEMSLHHVNLLHSSNPNVSSNKRIGFAVRYISTAFTQELDHHDVVLAAGECHGSHFRLLKSPPTGSLGINIKRQRIAHDFYMSKRSL